MKKPSQILTLLVTATFLNFSVYAQENPNNAEITKLKHDIKTLGQRLETLSKKLDSLDSKSNALNSQTINPVQQVLFFSQFGKFWDKVDYDSGDLNRFWLASTNKNTTHNIPKTIRLESRSSLITTSSKFIMIDDFINSINRQSIFAQRFTGINLRRTWLTNEELMTLNKEIGRIPVVDFYLGYNAFDKVKFGTLTSFLLFNLRDRIQILDLESIKPDLEGIKSLAEILKSMPDLQILYLGENSLGDEGLRILAPALASLRNLKILSLKSNKISQKGIDSLVAILPFLQNLTILDLKANNLDDASLKKFFEIAIHMSSLMFLDLESNYFKNKSEITKSLYLFPQLKYFWL